MATSTIQAGNLFSVNGLVAVITGGGSGIGLMMARALALNGAHKVYIIGRREQTLKDAAASVSTGNIIPVIGDVTSKDDLSRAVKYIEADTGYINVLVANSGILGPQAVITPATSIEEFQSAFWNTSVEDFADTFNINSIAAWYTVIAFLGLLDAGNKKGNVLQSSQVVATSSIAAFNKAAPGGYVYGQSKAAALHMMKQLGVGLIPYGIRSNIIAPGLYPSDLAAPLLLNKPTWPKTAIPLERIGTEEDMAGLILYLTSRAGAYVTGTVMLSDGGRLNCQPSTY